MVRIEPKEVRYIKLGASGAWEDACFHENRIYWGDSHEPHALALQGGWASVHQIHIELGYSKSVATGYVRQMRNYYTLGSDCLWITFARRHLWWAFAEPRVFLQTSLKPDSPSSYRKTIGGWRNTDIEGKLLAMDDLSSGLTQVAAYRQTICSVKAQAYLLRRINVDKDPLVENVRGKQAELVDAVAALIQQLHWSDFEVLVELLLARIGWRRTSRLGGTLKDIDISALLPATGERVDVQVKSTADQATFDACHEAFVHSGVADRFIFACHSPKGRLAIADQSTAPAEIWDPMLMASRAIDEGLTDWLIARAG